MAAAAAPASALTFRNTSRGCFCSPLLHAPLHSPCHPLLLAHRHLCRIAPSASSSPLASLPPHSCSQIPFVQPSCKKFDSQQGAASSHWRCDCCVESGGGDECGEEQSAKLFEDEESRALLRDLAAATERVAAARSELDVISMQEKLLSEFKTRLEQTEANDLVADCERDLADADAEVAATKLSLATAQAENSLFTFKNTSNTQEVDKNLERMYSIQAAAVSALSGVSASLPFAITSGQGLDLNFILSEGSILVSCALFGISFRYMVRGDLDNIHLKAGAAAAFSLVRGLGQIETAQMLVGCSKEGCREVLTATLNACESFFIFFFAALVLDLCLKEGLLKPFLEDKL